jgi:hypothetical protein
MLTYFNLITNNNFQNTLENRLRYNSKNKDYHFYKKIPTFYRYRAFSNYSVEAIVNKKIMLTNVS